MRRPLKAGRMWLAAVSFIAVIATALFVFAGSPVQVLAAGHATENNGVLAVEGHVDEGGHPLRGVTVWVKIPEKVRGHWVYKLVGKGETNRYGKFDIVVTNAPPHTYFVAFARGHGFHPIKKYVRIKPGHQVAFALAVTMGFNLAGVQTFVY